MTTENARLRLELEATLQRFEREMQKAVKSGTVTATTLENRFEAMNQKMAKSAAKGAAGLRKFTGVTPAARFAITNTANQIGDMAVQFESGTGAMRIMGQQFPQILGGFSALGGTLGLVAPLLGTVAAVGLPLAAMLLATGDSADKSSEKVKTFADKLNAAEAALRRAQDAAAMASRGGVEDLRQRFGELTKEVTELADALADIERRAAEVELGQLVASLNLDQLGEQLAAVVPDAVREAAGILADINKAVADRDAFAAGVDPADDFDLQTLKALDSEIAALQARLESLPDIHDQMNTGEAALAIINLQDRIAEASDAGNFSEMAGALSELREILASLGVEVSEGLLAELTRTEAQIREADAAFLDAEASAHGVASAASGIAPQIDAASASASALAGNLRAAMAALAGVSAGVATAQRRAANQLKVKASTVGDPVARAGGLAREAARERSGLAAYAAIRSGNLSALNEIERRAQSEADRAQGLAAAEESLRAAEKVYAESLKKPRGGGRGGGGGRSKGKGRSGRAAPSPEDQFFDGLDRDVERLQRQVEMIGKSKSEVAELEAKYRLLEAAKKADLSLDQQSLETGKTIGDVIDDRAAAVGRLTEQLERGQLTQRTFEQGVNGIADAMANAIVTGQDMGSALRSVFQGLAADIISSGLRNLLFSGLGSVFGGGLTAPAPVPSFDGGGYTGDGMRTGGIDGKGGFPAILHPRETVFDHTKGHGVGGGTVVLRVQSDPSVIVGIAQNTAGAMIEMNNSAVAKRTAQMQKRGG